MYHSGDYGHCTVPPLTPAVPSAPWAQLGLSYCAPAAPVLSLLSLEDVVRVAGERALDKTVVRLQISPAVPPLLLHSGNLMSGVLGYDQGIVGEKKTKINI